MDLSSLAGLGKVAGIGGMALGVVVLLLRPVIEHSGSLTPALQGWLLLTIALGAVGIGLVGMMLWALGSRAAGQRARTEGHESMALIIDRTPGGGGQDAATRGDRAPAVTIRGK